MLTTRIWAGGKLLCGGECNIKIRVANYSDNVRNSHVEGEHVLHFQELPGVGPKILWMTDATHEADKGASEVVMMKMTGRWMQ